MDRQQEQIVAAARKLGIEVVDLNDQWRMDVVRLRHRGVEHMIMQGMTFPGLSHQSVLLAGNKHTAKMILSELGIKTPHGIVFQDAAREAEKIESFFNTVPTGVCKPLNGCEGEGIRLNLAEPNAVIDHWFPLKKRYPAFLLEQQVEGRDLRIQAVDGQIVAACVRRPATLTGDGQTTVMRLITIENGKLAELNPLNRIEVDDQVRELLARQDLDLDSIPDKGRIFAVKNVANMSQGATAVDVTDEIHPAYGQMVAEAGRAFDLSIFAIDFMTSDHGSDPYKKAVAIEINAEPQWLHHTFSERRRHDLATIILKSIFNIA